MNRTRVLSTLALLVSAAAVAFTTNASPAAGIRGDEPRDAAPRHRARVSDPETARQIEVAGGRMLVDYGAFKLYEVPEDRVGALAAKVGFEFDADLDFIYLNAGTIDTRSAEAADRSSAAGSFSGKNMRLVQFIGPILPSWVEALEATGVEIVCYVPNNAYLVYGDDGNLAGLRTLSRSSAFVQWEGAYLADDRIHPDARFLDEKGNPREIGTDQFVVQVIKDKDENERTFALIEGLQLAPALNRFETLHYENVIVRLPARAIADIAARPDVVSIHPYFTPALRDERQDQIVAGNLTGNNPSGPGYLTQVGTWGFTQAQFTASGFAVDVTDSGIDNATTSPNHFGLFVSGIRPGTSRVVYNRLVGTANAGSTLQGCDGHGNLNAHIVAGYNDLAGFPHADASGFRYGLGVAPFVRVGSSVIFDPNTFTFPNYASLQSQAYNSGARISTNSWGAAVGGAYNVDSQAYDALVRDAQPSGSTVPAAGNQEMVIVFAAGNSGSGAGTVGSPGTAKNVITVGASEGVQAFGSADQCGVTDTDANSANDIIGFSSRGPCTDGRRKPEIVAPGTHISGGVAQTASPGVNGTANACFDASGVCAGPGASNFFPVGQQWYTASSGTSHSCPAVAGGAALLRQYFLNQSLAAPSPAMTKAYLTNSARYMNGTGANDTLWSNNQGMGMMNLGMAFDAAARVLRDQVPGDTFTATGQSRTFTGTVPDNTRPFRVSIAWTDAPGSTTGNAFNNNLDLSVTVGGMTYRGNVFSGANSTTGGTADTRNNLESVFLPAGVAGAYVITVTATNIVSDGVPNSGGALDQDFALVVSNGVEGVVPVIAAAGSTLTAESCTPSNSVLDPGETVTLNFGLQNAGTANTTSLVATLQATGGVTSPSGPQNYGVVVAGGPTITRPFTFTVDSGLACGATVTATFQLQDGATNLGTVTFTFTLGTASPATTTFSNAGSITIPATGTSGVASPYPSTIVVSGLSGTITKVTARLVGWSHTFPDDVDVVLIGPAGQSVILASDTGGSSPISSVSITFDDAAATSLPDGTLITSGTFKPTNIGAGDTFAAPAPAGPYGSTLSVFNGTAPNGNWQLYVVDDTGGDIGSISGGWQVTITASASTCATTCAAVCTITCPANVTVPAAAGQCSAPASYAAPTTTGSCGTVTCTPASGSSFPVGTTTVNCTTTAGPSCSFTVTVTDTQAPTVTCPANVTVGNTAGQCSAVVTYTTPTASDNCPGATVSCAPASGSTFPVGTTTVTCTATDASANTGTCSFTVTVQDTQAPTVTCPTNITVGNTAGQCSAVVSYSTPTASDNCPGATVACVPASGATFPVGTTTVTCTASDASANSPDGTCSFTVTVQDTQAPTVSCPANITQPATAGQCSATVTYTTPTGADNCPGVVTVNCAPASGSTFPVGSTTVTCTASDVSASSPDGTCTFTVTVTDTQAPTVTCLANITTGNTAGQCSAVVTYTTPTATDNCPGATVACVPVSGSTFPVGTTTVTCTATDASANTGTCSFTVTVQDTQAPTVSCPANITQPTTGGQCSRLVNYTTPTGTDNCPGPVTVTCVPASGSTFPVGTTTVTCTAADGSPNSPDGTCTFTVTINDAQAPTVACPANITLPNTAGQCSRVVSFTTPVGVDNCPGPVAVACLPASGSTFPVGVTTVTCLAMDAAGNQGGCTFTVTIQDTQAPTVVCPANITVVESPPSSGSATVTYTTPAASDNCPGATVNCLPASGSSFPVGTTTVTCTATDAAANTGSCTFTIMVQPACTITCPANLTVPNTTGQCGATVNYAAPTTTGVCGTVTCVPASGSFFAVGTTTVNCSTTSGPTCSFTVTVQDTQAPVANCPAPITVPNATGQCSAVVSYTATASDNCPGATIACVPASGSTFPVGTTTVTCTASDASPNSPDGTCSFSVTVQDTQAPAITCPANMTVPKTPGQCSTAVSYTVPTPTDNCPGASASCTPASGSTFPVGVTTVTCTATDGSPNSPDATCTFTITVTDTTAPVITCPANVTVPNTTGQCSATVNYAAPTTTDNCPGTTVSCSPASGSTFPVGATTVNCTATDASNNTSSCSFTVTVQDTQAPVATCPAPITVAAATGTCSAVVSYTATATDNCPGVTIVCAPASGSTFPVGVTTVNCTASDGSPNSPDATCAFTVTVQDTQLPAITCPANIVVTSNTTTGCTFTQVVNYPAPTATDNCGLQSVVCVPPSGSTFNEGTTTVVCTATDTSGNTAACSFTVTVGAAFGYCAVDDATGDRFQMVVNPASPSYGVWRYTVVATNTTYCGRANYTNYVSGVRLRAYDNDYSAENPTYFMDANFKATSGTVTVRNVSGTVRLTLRDRNTLDSLCP